MKIDLKNKDPQIALKSLKTYLENNLNEDRASSTVQWELTTEFKKDKNIKLTLDETYLIRYNLKRMWEGYRRNDKFFNKIRLFQPVSKRLHLDFTLILQGGNEVILCWNKGLLK